MHRHSDLKISVITVCFNSERCVERTIQSVLSQTHRNIEYIVIDGGSKDRTTQIIGKYRGDISYFVSEQDNGIYDAQNKGIKAATGDIVCVLNSDDYFYDSRVLENIADCFMSKPGLDFVYGDMLCVSSDNSQVCLKKYPRRISKRYFLREPLGHCATFLRRDSFLRVGYYDTRYKISADYEWFLRALFKKGLKGFYIPQIVSVFSLGGISGDQNTYKEEMDTIINIYYSPYEKAAGRGINFLLSADIFRFALRLMLGDKGYLCLRSRWRRASFLQYKKHLAGI